MSSFDLVIFDMDGTLVDSEEIADAAVARAIQEATHIDVPRSVLSERYRGHIVPYMLNDLPNLLQCPLPHNFIPILDRTWGHAVNAELKVVPGAFDCIASVQAVLSVCVASNGPRTSLARYLDVTGLDKYFALGENMFSADDVAQGKPAPDLFLHAAASFGVSPTRCIVLEDSLPGVEAAIAAGMTVVGFTGCHRDNGVPLHEYDIDIIDDFVDFPPMALR